MYLQKVPLISSPQERVESARLRDGRRHEEFTGKIGGNYLMQDEQNVTRLATFALCILLLKAWSRSNCLPVGDVGLGPRCVTT